MKAFTPRLAAAAALLTSYATATPVSNCPQDNVCYAVGVPEVSASSGSGNVYFQMSAPTSYSWIGMGTGSRMAGSTMFILYTDGTGNVTVSPRRATGRTEPDHDPSINVELLAGSGVSGSNMIANFVVSNLDIELDSSQSPWIAGWRTGDAIDSTSPSASISQHNARTTMSFDLSEAALSTDSNPFGDAPTGNTGSNADNNDDDDDDDSGSGSLTPDRTLLYAHALIASIAFVILMPFGSLLMPALDF